MHLLLARRVAWRWFFVCAAWALAAPRLASADGTGLRAHAGPAPNWHQVATLRRAALARAPVLQSHQRLVDAYQRRMDAAFNASAGLSSALPLSEAEQSAYHEFVVALRGSDAQLERTLDLLGVPRQAPVTGEALYAQVEAAWRAVVALAVAETLYLDYGAARYYQRLRVRPFGGAIRRALGSAGDYADARRLLSDQHPADGAARGGAALADLAQARLRERFVGLLRGADRIAPGVLPPGSSEWWDFLSQITGAPLLPYQEAEVLIDGPDWQRGTRSVVDQAEGSLALAGLYLQPSEHSAALVSAIERQVARQPKGKSLSVFTLLSTMAQARTNKQLNGDEAGQAAGDSAKAEIGLLLKAIGACIRDRSWQPWTDELRRLEALGANLMFAHHLRANGFAGPLGPVWRALQLSWRPGGFWATAQHTKLVATKGRAVEDAKPPKDAAIAAMGGSNFGPNYLDDQYPLGFHDLNLLIKGPEIVRALLEGFFRQYNAEAELSRRGGVGSNGHAIDYRATDEQGRSILLPEGQTEQPAGHAVIVGTNNLSFSEYRVWSYRAAKAFIFDTAHGLTLTTPHLTDRRSVKAFIGARRRVLRWRRAGYLPPQSANDEPDFEAIVPLHSDEAWANLERTIWLLARLPRAGVSLRLWDGSLDPRRLGDGTPYYREGSLMHMKSWLIRGIDGTQRKARKTKIATVGSVNQNRRTDLADDELLLILRDDKLAEEIEQRVLVPTRQATTAAPSWPILEQVISYLRALPLRGLALH